MDKHLTERLAADGDDALQKVIITMKPGAKRRLVGELRGQGHKVDKDFGLIDGFAGRISGRRLRALLDDPDVAAISADADVTADGIMSSVTGTAQGTSYSLRRTLGLDGSIDVGATSSVTPGLKMTTVSWSHTVAAGNNRLLVVGVAIYEKSGATATAVTFGGVALTKIGRAYNDSSFELWRLKAPAVGTAAIVVSLSAQSAVAAGATTFYGVDQTTPLGAFSSATGSAGTKSVTFPSAVGEVAIAGAASRAVSTATATGGQTQQWTGKTGTSGGDIWGVTASAAGAASVAMSWSTTGSGTGAWAIGAVSIKPASPGLTTARTGAGVTVAVIDSGLLQDGGRTAAAQRASRRRATSRPAVRIRRP